MVSPYHLLVLCLRHLSHPDISRLCENHLVLWTFALDSPAPVVIGNRLQGSFDLLGCTPHQEFARWNEVKFHADGIGVLDRYAEVLRPSYLMLIRSLGIERCNCWRGGICGPTGPGCGRNFFFRTESCEWGSARHFKAYDGGNEDCQGEQRYHL